MPIKTFNDITAWRKAHDLVLTIYRITDDFPRHEMFGLTSQMRRCAVSIPSDIAEGFKRRTQKDSRHFYNVAEGSLEELKYQLRLARDLKYITGEIYVKVLDQAEEVGKLIYGWKSSQK